MTPADARCRQQVGRLEPGTHRAFQPTVARRCTVAPNRPVARRAPVAADAPGGEKPLATRPLPPTTGRRHSRRTSPTLQARDQRIGAGGSFSALPLLLLLVSLAIVIPWGPWWIRWGIVGIASVSVVVAMIVLPPIRYRVFWYAISPTEIDIQHGIIFIKRSVVPVHRVQNLRTERGPMADHYRMTNLKIRTAAGSVNLSGLDRTEADELCERISRLADVADDV